MNALRIAGFAILACAAAMTVRAWKPELALQTGVAAGIMLLLIVTEELAGVYAGLAQYAESFGVPTDYIKAMLKVTGIVYLIQFAAETCRDAGENAIAAKTELAGRVMILSVCVPVIKTVFELMLKISGGVL